MAFFENLIQIIVDTTLTKRFEVIFDVITNNYDFDPAKFVEYGPDTGDFLNWNFNRTILGSKEQGTKVLPNFSYLEIISKEN